MPLIDSISKLRENTGRWTREVSSGSARGTLLQGIAGKAVNGFENVLREALAYYLDRCELSYASELASDFGNKPLEKLTLGEVVQSFGKLDTKLTRCLQSKFTDAGEVTGTKKLIGKAHKEGLSEITKLRNLLHHDVEKFAKDETTLMENTNRLLSLIQQKLSEPLFQIVIQAGITGSAN